MNDHADTKQFRTVAELAAFLDSLHEMTDDGGVMAHKWEPAQRALAALEAGRSGEAVGTILITEATDGYVDNMALTEAGKRLPVGEHVLYAATPQPPPPVGVTDGMIRNLGWLVLETVEQFNRDGKAVSGFDVEARIREVLSQQQPAPSVSEEHQAASDAMNYGVGFLVDGKRVAPERVIVEYPAKDAAPVSEPAEDGSLLTEALHAFNRGCNEQRAKSGARQMGRTAAGVAAVVDLVTRRSRSVKQIPPPAKYPKPGETGNETGPCCAHAYADGFNECRRIVLAANLPVTTGQGDVERLANAAGSWTDFIKAYHRAAESDAKWDWTRAAEIAMQWQRRVSEALTPFGQQQEATR